MKKVIKREYGFTLIELLIVVAIIAILAAIAIPNFLQAQIRAKVSRTLAEYQTLDTALEAYEIDNNQYIPTRYPVPLTTPISYLSSMPVTPWNDTWRWATDPGDEMDLAVHTYLIVTNIAIEGVQFFGTNGAPGADNIQTDYYAYLGNFEGMNQYTDVDSTAILWEIKTQGPDGYDDIDVANHPGDYPNTPGAFRAQLYDPSNGTVSWGDIVWFNNGTGSGRAQ